MHDTERTKGATTIEPGMSASVIMGTVVFASALGLRPDDLEAATGFSIAALTQPDTRFPEDVVAKIWARLLQARPGQPLPLQMAAAAPYSYFGPLAFGAQFAATVREALAILVRYHKVLSSSLDVSLDEVGDTATLSFHHPADSIDSGAAAVVGVALGARFFREVIRVPESLQGAQFAGTSIGPAAAYDEFFGVPVVFDAPRHGLVFARAALDIQPPAHDTELLKHIYGHLNLAHGRLIRDALSNVREAIATNAARSEYGAEALAKRMAVSLRVLQRHVASHGTTLRKLLDEAREAYARQFLGDMRLSIEEIAFLLGYSDERAFRRAFRRMSDMTPAQFRRQLRTATS